MISRHHEQDGAQEDALVGAQKYCEKRQKDYVVVSDNAKYRGDMDEKTRNTVKKVSQAAWKLGGMDGAVNTAGSAGRYE